MDVECTGFLRFETLADKPVSVIENQQQAVKAALEATEHALQVLNSAKRSLDMALARNNLIPASHDTLNFQQLPAEIRIKVYRELLLSPSEIDPVFEEMP